MFKTSLILGLLYSLLFNVACLSPAEELGQEETVNAGKADGADSWQHRVLNGPDGLTISLDYIKKAVAGGQYKSAYSGVVASPFYINIHGGNLKASDKVRIVIVNYAELSYTSYQNSPTTYTLDLEWTNDALYGDHFSAEIGQATETQGTIYFTDVVGSLPLYLTSYGMNMKFHQEIAVVINDEWVDVPGSDSHNFSFNLME